MTEFIHLEYGSVPNYNGKYLLESRTELLSSFNLDEVLKNLLAMIKPKKHKVSHQKGGILVEVEY